MYGPAAAGPRDSAPRGEGDRRACSGPRGRAVNRRGGACPGRVASLRGPVLQKRIAWCTRVRARAGGLFALCVCALCELALCTRAARARLQCLVGTPMLFNLILSQHSHSKLIEENRLAPDLYE